MRRISSGYLGILFCSAYLSLLPASAAPGDTQRNIWGSNVNKPVEQSLKEVPELPQLPTYSGKSKLISGTVQNNDDGWVVYSFYLLTQEEPTQVMQWYQSALKNYQWKTLSANRGNITADQKNGNLCSITIGPSAEPGFKSTLQMVYSIPPHGIFPN